jgi:lysophospholipase L1-like esterase
VSRIFIQGDSTTQGYCDLEYGGWADRLKRDLIPHPKHDAINFALSGQTLAQLVRRFPGQVAGFGRTRSLGVFMLGGADSYTMRGSAEPLNPIHTFADNLKALGDICIQYRITPVFTGYHRVDESRTNPFPNGDTVSNERLAQYEELVLDFARHIGAPVVDLSMFPDYPLHEVLADDGSHPNTVGHALIHAQVADVVQGRLEEPLLTYT